MANNGFEIQNCILVSEHFELNYLTPPNKDITLDVQINLNHEYNDTENLLRLFLGVDVVGNNVPITITTKLMGIFKFESKPESQIELVRQAEITCASIVFPFAREIIADTTRRAGLPPLMLKPFNFIEMYNANHPETPV